MTDTHDPARTLISIAAPDGPTVLAARHLDAAEGPVQVGSIVDPATRGAITTVLRYIATAHNSPAATDAETLARVRQLEARLRENTDTREMPVSAVCHSIANDLRVALAHGDRLLPSVSPSAGAGEIQLSRQRGRGLIVETAPPRARTDLEVVADHGSGLSMEGGGRINIGDQVLYQVVGYDAERASLIVELVEDWRPDSVVPPAVACTPIPASTLMQLSEVPPELRAGADVGDGICTATGKIYNGPTVRCAQTAGHYDEGKQPDYRTDDGPGGWHRSQPDATGSCLTWSDQADDATPHKGAS